MVAGSFQGYTGHVDGKPSDARFNHPKGVTMDDKGNVYVADTLNLAIRKISDAGICSFDVNVSKLIVKKVNSDIFELVNIIGTGIYKQHSTKLELLTQDRDSFQKV